MWQLCTQTPDNAISGGIYGEDADAGGRGGSQVAKLATHKLVFTISHLAGAPVIRSSRVGLRCCFSFGHHLRERAQSEETNQDNDLGHLHVQILIIEQGTAPDAEDNYSLQPSSFRGKCFILEEGGRGDGRPMDALTASFEPPLSTSKWPHRPRPPALHILATLSV